MQLIKFSARFLFEPAIIHQFDDLVFPLFFIPDQESYHSGVLKLNKGHESFFEK